MTIRKYGKRPDVAHYNAYMLDSAIKEQAFIGDGYQSKVHPQEWWSQRSQMNIGNPKMAIG